MTPGKPGLSLRMRADFLTPKGSDSLAQGNALGNAGFSPGLQPEGLCDESRIDFTVLLCGQGTFDTAVTRRRARALDHSGIEEILLQACGIPVP